MTLFFWYKHKCVSDKCILMCFASRDHPIINSGWLNEKFKILSSFGSQNKVFKTKNICLYLAPHVPASYWLITDMCLSSRELRSLSASPHPRSAQLLNTTHLTHTWIQACTHTHTTHWEFWYLAGNWDLVFRVNTCPDGRTIWDAICTALLWETEMNDSCQNLTTPWACLFL